METMEHVFTCPKVNIIWRELQQTMSKWASNNNAAPGLMAAILSGIHQWQQHDLPIPNNSLPQDIKEAFNAQTKIGWYAATKGFLPFKCQEAQDKHFKNINSKCRGY
eukprot:7164187-Ditylum_brightwellii.AAC.2